MKATRPSLSAICVRTSRARSLPPAVSTATAQKRSLRPAMQTSSRSAGTSRRIPICRTACKHKLPLTPYVRAAFWGGDEKGYTDFPDYRSRQTA